MSAQAMPYPNRGDPLSEAALSDQQLLAMVRGGDVAAFGELYIRYRRLGGFVARAESNNPSDAADVVGEAFAAVFQSITHGRGPVESFRPYLLTTIRRMAHRRNQTAARLVLTDSSTVDALAVAGEDHVLGTHESILLVHAFRELPRRWQDVLWYVDVEGLKPAQAGPLLGLTPNALSALALRAREGLRQGYLQKHVGEPISDSCADYLRHLGRYVRNGVRGNTQARIRHHVGHCTHCSAVLAELRELQVSMRTKSKQ
ncbi:RNA polymerase sigma factor (sigma-70 family) [Paenarthrobacter nitroguajacolicus]|uniref:sigma-70 family RNA polymerase sigma factor n=1 Tax=Paenarthrobacter TaxID=1742992 RepID=UPI0028629927|nr:sigma-70 family RNA polymerase sigma factor [Paenarthrobacter nitroguajacolicus]MDR6986832.1 RNA polymerase sigma factor (sigma-70 family) [Paenarthrobacter nitroguajacolicus]